VDDYIYATKVDMGCGRGAVLLATAKRLPRGWRPLPIMLSCRNFRRSGRARAASQPRSLSSCRYPPSERRKVTDHYDVGQATMAMMIAATDLGIGTGHSSVGEQDKARAILSVPEGYEVAYLLGVGYPADRPLKPIRKPNRRPFEEVVHQGHW
jgi:nitroreductase